MNLLTVLAPLLVVGMLVALVVGQVVPWLAAVCKQPDRTSVWGSPLLVAALMLTPWVVGGLAALALGTPDPFQACHCTTHGLHHPHLCLQHPSFAGPLLLPCLGLLALWLVAAVPRGLRLALEVVASARWARKMCAVPALKLDGIPIRLVAIEEPTAFALGALRPVIVVSSTLWNGLSESARRAVVHHEWAHVQRGDGFTLLTLRLAAALLPQRGADALLQRWRAATELECDAVAANYLGDPTVVAQALVSVNRLRSELAAGGRATSPRLALGIGQAPELERRVLTLLSAASASARAPRLSNDILAVCLGALGASAVMTVLPGDTLHHSFETIVGLLLR